jgi:biotin operon repressor
LFSARTLGSTVPEVKKAMNEAAAASGYSRETIVDRMNDLAGRHGVALKKGNAKGITLADLEQWLKPAEIHRFPSLSALSVFCAALDTSAPLAALGNILGVRVIGDKDAALLRWAKAYHRAKAARDEMRIIEGDL